MITDNTHIENLIARYLAGDITLQEQIELDDWITASDENRKYFDDIQHIFFKSASNYKYKKLDTQKAWEQMHEKMHRKKDVIVASRSFSSGSRTIWIGIAASILILLSIIFFVERHNDSQKNANTIMIASGNMPVERTLPDDSKVTLNRNSAVSYNLNKEKKQKELVIKGEAFVEVKQTAGTPLIVIAGNTFIRDIGTSFNVKAYDDNRKIEVFVKTGAVVFFTSVNKGITLKEGEMGIYNKDSDIFMKKEESPNVIAYKTRNFVFKNTRLSDVIALLDDVYETKIGFLNPGLADCTITVSFNNETIEAILSVITETLDLSYKKTGAGFMIMGEQCQSH